MTVTSYNKSSTYTGTSFTPPTTEDPPEIEGLLDTDASEVYVTEDFTAVDAGEWDNTCTVHWGSVNKDNYEVTNHYGTLTINPLPMEFYLGGDEYSYNGEYRGAQLGVSCDDEDYETTQTGTNTWHVSHGAGAEIDVTLTGGGTDVNEYPLSASWTFASGKPGNFYISTAGETLKITPLDVTVTITGHTATKPYNGESQSVEGYDVTSISSSLYDESMFTFSGTAMASGTTANTYEMGLTADQFTNNNSNFNVNFSVTDGSLEIKPLEVSVGITGHNETYDYTGESYAVQGYTASISSVTPAYEESYFSFSGESNVVKSEPGTWYMSLEPDQFTNNNSNYQVTFTVLQDGYLKINEPIITFDLHSPGNIFAIAYQLCPSEITGTYADGTPVEGSSEIYYAYEGSYPSGVKGTFTLRNGAWITIDCKAPDPTPGTYTYPTSVEGADTCGYTIEYKNYVMVIDEPGSGHGGS